MEYGEKHPEESGGRLSDDGRDPLLDHPQGNPQQQDCGGQQKDAAITPVYSQCDLLLLLTYYPDNHHLSCFPQTAELLCQSPKSLV